MNKFRDLTEVKNMGDNFAIGVALAIFFIIYIGGIIVCNKLDLLTSSKKKVKEAIKRGHVVKAHYIQGSKKVDQMQRTSGRDYERYSASYRYVVNGKEYRQKGIWFKGLPEETITLYYLDNPEKAFLYNEVTDKKFIRNIMPVVLLVAAAIAAGKVYNLFS